MPNIVVCACFRHCPEEDGHAIPASITRPDPRCSWETVVDPIIGFMGVLSRGDKVRWSFIKYDAPDCRFRKKSDKTPSMRPASISTTRVGHLTCPSCGWSGIYPAWGKPESVPCPSCTGRGMAVNYIREGSPEFFELMGAALQSEIEAGLNRSPCGSGLPEFRFPDVLAIGKIPPGPEVPPEFQGYANAIGLSARSLSTTAPDILFGDGMDEKLVYGACLQLLPGTTLGVLDSDEARKGWSVSSGMLTNRVFLPWLRDSQSPCGGMRCGGARI